MARHLDTLRTHWLNGDAEAECGCHLGVGATDWLKNGDRWTITGVSWGPVPYPMLTRGRTCPSPSKGALTCGSRVGDTGFEPVTSTSLVTGCDLAKRTLTCGYCEQ